MNMSSSSMAMSVRSTTASASTAATTSAMDMSMDMSMGPGACRISMLWNWYTIDACFISSTWQIHSAGAFAGSCISVILLVVSLELLRRIQREFDRHLIRQKRATRIPVGNLGRKDSEDRESGSIKQPVIVSVRSLELGAAGGRRMELKVWQQMVRSLLYMMQFAVGYFVMLLAMYYNGYIIIMIFVGAFLGATLLQWDTFDSSLKLEQKEACC